MLDNVIVSLHYSVVDVSAQLLSMLIHFAVIFIGLALVRGYYSVFRVHPSNVSFAMIMLLSSMVTISVMLFFNSIAWFFAVCLFCELNAHYIWAKALWSMVYATGFVVLYLVIKQRISL